MQRADHGRTVSGTLVRPPSGLGGPPAVGAHRHLNGVDAVEVLVVIEEAGHGIEMCTASVIVHSDDSAVRRGECDQIYFGHRSGPLEQLRLGLEERAGSTGIHADQVPAFPASILVALLLPG